MVSALISLETAMEWRDVLGLLTLLLLFLVVGVSMLGENEHAMFTRLGFIRINQNLYTRDDAHGLEFENSQCCTIMSS